MTYTMAYDFAVHDRADRADTERFEKEFPTLDEAETAGMHIGCTRGCSRVEVFSPDGTLQALWDKESAEVIRKSYGFDDDGYEIYDDTHMSSRWQRLGDESKALGKRHYDESVKEMQKAMKEKNRG